MILLVGISFLKSQNTPCLFVDSTLSFAGTPINQAKCLLRPVKKYGQLGLRLRRLPAPLDNLIGKPFEIELNQLNRYLKKYDIQETDIGGELTKPLSCANDNDLTAPYARYFNIHDTSTPNFLDKPFPKNINDPSWEHNDLSRWDEGDESKAHVFINLIGESITAVDFSIPWRGTKFEVKILKQKGKGLCLNIELCQPRRRDPNGSPTNDAIAPVPGFTGAQLDRLALVYVAASARKGEWMIPAFHAAMDAGIRNAHDDPQNFNLSEWAERLGGIIEEIKTQ